MPRGDEAAVLAQRPHRDLAAALVVHAAAAGARSKVFVEADADLAQVPLSADDRETAALEIGIRLRELRSNFLRVDVSCSSGVLVGLRDVHSGSGCSHFGEVVRGRIPLHAPCVFHS